jgi:outer membrane protein assembly factor BamD (BamD/ComL family)
VKHRKRILVELTLAMGLLTPVAFAQKPPPPAPSPQPPTSPNNPSNPVPSSNTQPGQSDEDLVMFIMGRVATEDGSAIPSEMLVERMCNGGVRQQVHPTAHGDFSMQLTSMADSFLDATGDRSALNAIPNRTSQTGIPRRELANCEMRATAAGFRSNVAMLVDVTSFSGTIDVGSLTVHRIAKVQGATVNAAELMVPNDARKAYEKGLGAVRNAKTDDARKYFEKAVQIYPKYTRAWFQLGSLLQKQGQKDDAFTAYTRATAIDSRYLPPYLSLAVMASDAHDWTEVVRLTGHILDSDPLNHSNAYIVDLDPLNCTEAYFYNAFANYKLNKIDDAEKSALKAEQRADVGAHYPQLHLLLAEIFAQKNNYPGAINEMQTYLELVPHAKDADQVRAQLAKLEKLNGAATNNQADQN